MTINQQVIEGQWNQIKGKVRNHWGQLSEDELEQARGNVDQLVGLIQEKTGEAREAVESYIEQASGNGASIVSRASEGVREGAEHAAEAAYQAMGRASDAVRAGYVQTEQMIRRRPLESLSVCFGVGLITGLVVGLMVRSK